MVITQTQVNHKERSIDTGLLLDHKENNVSIDFTALHFKHPVLIQFRYRLIGLDDTWIETQEPSASYAPLQPGDYEFQVQSRLGISPWNEGPTTLARKIHKLSGST